MRRLALVVVPALLAAGCGGGSSPGRVAASDPAVAFARCMRSHGVPRWPDPTSGGVFDKSRLTTQALGAAPARVDAAEAGCRHLLPNGPGSRPTSAQEQAARATALRFSRCVRAHGVPGFPDPGSDGRIPDPATVGIDQGSPAFEAANSACAPYRPPYMPSNADYGAWARSHG